ncbi:MAG: DUF2442 domain-containing protein [Thermodesulfobacteriota bacterium]
MFKPVEVKALPNYKIWVKYSDGVEGEVDLSHLAGKGVFAVWNYDSAFEMVYICSHGQIVWIDKIDICPDSIYMKITGKSPEELFQNLNKEKLHA